MVIADDLTGGLDTGIAFAEAGIPTCVGLNDDFPSDDDTRGCGVQVAVVPSRHMTPEDAYRSVYDVVKRAADQKFTYIFKKTDSALRGNVGAELDAVKDAAGAKRLFFVPAFPKMRRVTRNGIQYIDGNIPVSESVFATDPFNPVLHSSVLAILAQTTAGDASLSNVRQKELPEGILVFDAETRQDVLETAKWITSRPDGHLLAGCAGLASVLPEILELEEGCQCQSLPRGNLMVFCGSVNPISLEQCREAGNDGAPEYHLIGDGKYQNPSLLARQIAHSAAAEPVTVFDTVSANVSGADPNAQGKVIAQLVGRVIHDATEVNPDAIPMIIGGDTLLEFLRQRKIGTIYPMWELFPGVVMAYYFYQGRKCYLISKSGGFGEKTLLRSLRQKLSPQYGEVRSGGV